MHQFLRKMAERLDNVPLSAPFDERFYGVTGERGELESFIRERPDVQAFLRLIPELVLKHFGAESAKLELCTDPENGKADVRVHIMQPYRLDELYQREEAFFNELPQDEFIDRALHDINLKCL